MDPLVILNLALANKEEQGQVHVIKLATELLDREQPGLIEGALETLDRAPVRRLVTKEYKRELHVVRGRDQLEYTILSQTDCTCPSFEQMQCRSTHPKCKHLLAVRLAPMLGRLEIQEIHDDQYHSYCGLPAS